MEHTNGAGTARRARLPALLFVAASACGCAHPTAPEPPPRASAADARRAPVSAAPFEALRDRALAQILDDSPGMARWLGMHEYDGKVPHESRAAIEGRIARWRSLRAELTAFDPRGLSEDEALDRAELIQDLELSLFCEVDLEMWRKYPETYETLFAVNRYLDVPYAPIEVRAEKLLAHEEAALMEVPHVRENLTLPLSRALSDVASRSYAGYATYLREEAAVRLREVGGAAFHARFDRTNEALAREADALAALFKEQAARGDESHVLGEARFRKLLLVQEGLDRPLEELTRMNEENLRANRAAYDALAGAAHPTYLDEAHALDDARAMVAQTERFVREKQLVTLASDDAVTVRQMPAFDRWNFASMDLSGPFEPVRAAYMNVNLPDPALSPAERREYLGTKGNLLLTTVHELFPGHFTQLRRSERAPTRVQKILGSYSFVEGWAHYAEQLAIEEGLGADDPQNRLAQLHEALLRNCRFAASFAIHAHGASVADAEDRFVRDCRQTRSVAHEQALRATFDPGYFAYTLGKLQILALREEARHALGERFSLRRFHDALLAHGAPPVPLVRERVLREIGAAR